MKTQSSQSVLDKLEPTKPSSPHHLIPSSLFFRKVVLDKLELTKPDYVFAKNYNLMPLLDVEKYIIANKHLPNIKSADEYTSENNRVDIGELQTKLLEKVEELTLYIIQQQKQIDELLVCQKKGFAKASRKLKLAK